jgi:hypothetical protein
MIRLLVLVACLLPLACADAPVPPSGAAAKSPGDAPPSPAVPAPASDPGAPKAPFVLTAKAPDVVAKGDVAEVTVEVIRSAPSELPIELRVRASPGLRLVEGPTAEFLEEKGPTITRHYRVEVEDPAAVLEVTATLRTEGAGAFARRELRFDGAEPPAVPQALPGAPVVPADGR